MKMRTYVLIDRSGSMAGGWIETIGAMKTFAKGIKGKLFAALFDSYGGGVEFIKAHDGKAKKWDVRASMEAHPPRASTPLYDAVGRLNAEVMADKPEKAQIVIVTDGYENASREVTQVAVRSIIAGWEEKGYDVVYLGASFAEATQQAAAMGINASKTANMANSKTYRATMSAMSARNMSYSEGQTLADDDLGDEVRKKAAGE